MSGGNPTTQMRIGAATEAAGHIRATQAQHSKSIQSIVNEHAQLKPHYSGGDGATALNALVTQWAEQAEALVKEFENFATRMVDTDKRARTGQESQTQTLTSAKSTFRTSI